jgi:hypothetical protein
MQAETPNLWIAAAIFIVVVIGANLLMLGKARGLRDFKGRDFFNFGNATKPWKKEDDNLRELHQRVRDLKEKRKDEDNRSQK